MKLMLHTTDHLALSKNLYYKLNWFYTSLKIFGYSLTASGPINRHQANMTNMALREVFLAFLVVNLVISWHILTP